MRIASFLPATACLTLALLADLRHPLLGAEQDPRPTPGADAADAVAITPAAVQQELVRALQTDPTLWQEFDLDHDGRISQVEIVACLARRPAWLRTHFPALFRRIDTDGDRAISIAELQAFAARAGDAFTVTERPRSVMDASRAAAAAGGGAGAGMDVDAGGATASVAFMHQQAYIQGYQVVNGQYDPVIGVLGTGTVLTVGPVLITIVHGAPAAARHP